MLRLWVGRGWDGGVRGGDAYGDLEEAKLCGEVEGGVAVVAEVRVLKALGIVFDYAFDEGGIVEVDGSAKTD